MIDYLLLFPLPILLIPILFLVGVAAFFGIKEGFQEVNIPNMFIGFFCAALFPCLIWFLVRGEIAIYRWLAAPDPISISEPEKR